MAIEYKVNYKRKVKTEELEWYTLMHDKRGTDFIETDEKRRVKKPSAAEKF